MDPLSFEMNLELLPLSQIDVWMREAHVLDMDKVTTTDIGLCFFKFRKRAINYEEFLEYIEDLANTKQYDLEEMKNKLLTCNKPLRPEDVKKKKPLQ